jgi:hypothetical protein
MAPNNHQIIKPGNDTRYMQGVKGASILDTIKKFIYVDSFATYSIRNYLKTN